MPARQLMIWTLAISAAFLGLAGCASSETDGSDMMTVQQTQYGVTYASDGAVMRHTIRQMAETDVTKMQRLIDKEINMNEADENVFLDEASSALAQTVLLQPDFNVREVALRELKGRLEPEQYPIVLSRAADQLLEIFHSSQVASDQAGALLALTNLVVEVRSLKNPELKSILQKIADANLKVSREAKKYAVEPMEGLISPSLEARSALKTL